MSGAEEMTAMEFDSSLQPSMPPLDPAIATVPQTPATKLNSPAPHRPHEEPIHHQPHTLASLPPAEFSVQAYSHSVAPELMQVYESMTGSAPSRTAAHHGDTAPQHPTSWSYEDAASFPSIPENPFDVTASTVSRSSKPRATQKPSRSSTKRSRNSLKRANDEAEATASSGTTRASKSRRKQHKDSNDGRWCKRFTWPESLHRDFCAAIFDVGLKHASPSSILEHMPQHNQVTSERVKSHLQKYRLNRAKSKKEFMTCYDATLLARKNQKQSGRSLGGGDVAAHVAYATLVDKDEGTESCTGSAGSLVPASVESRPCAGDSFTVSARSQSPEATENFIDNTNSLVFPKLTEEEKRSHIGQSMGYLMGLFFTLKQQLSAQREAKGRNPNVTAVYKSFLHGSVQPRDSSARSGGAGTGRVNLEENSMMKREMEAQMVFQNKMRALQHQEREKYKALPDETAVTSASQEGAEGNESDTKTPATDGSPPTSFNHDVNDSSSQQEDGDPSRLKHREASIGAADELWNTDVVDDQLFEFLMNN